MCKYCENDNNDFININPTVLYTGIEVSINRQGLMRVRYYDDINNNFIMQDVIDIKFCPKCGKKFNK